MNSPIAEVCSRKIVLLATERYSINLNDFYMFFRRTQHEIVAFLYYESCPDKKWWVEQRFDDPARDKLYDQMDFEALRLIQWSTQEELLGHLDALEFDYVCMGNGTGVEQIAVRNHVGVERCLYSEYGWLPWSGSFYISRNGCGDASEIATVDEDFLSKQMVRKGEINELQNSFKGGGHVWRWGFIYLPLQKDVNDFKFTLTDFASNEEFLDFVHETVPPRMKVLVKRHPLYPKEYDFKKYGRFIDISGKNLNKFQLYRRMRAMMCINSTSILEALAFGGRVFAYGRDIFMNKGLVHFDIRDPNEFAAKLREPVRTDLCRAFTSLLLERQVSRKRCIEDDQAYIDSHYWNRAL